MNAPWHDVASSRRPATQHLTRRHLVDRERALMTLRGTSPIPAMREKLGQSDSKSRDNEGRNDVPRVVNMSRHPRSTHQKGDNEQGQPQGARIEEHRETKKRGEECVIRRKPVVARMGNERNQMVRDKGSRIEVEVPGECRQCKGQNAA